MWIAQTTRSPLTAIQTEYSYSRSYSDSLTLYTSSGSQTGKTDGSGATSGKTDDLGPGLRTTYGGTTDASGGRTTSSTNSVTSGAGASAGAHTVVALFTGGFTTYTVTRTYLTVSTASDTIYTFPKSTVATSTESTTQTNETAASEYTTLYGSTTTTTTGSSLYTQTTTKSGPVESTYRDATYTPITCSAQYDQIDTAFWLNDDERGWGFTGGAGLRPLNSLCTEATNSFTTSATTTSTVELTRPVVDWLTGITYSLMGVTNSTVTASWTEVAAGPASNTVNTFRTIDNLPNSTLTLYGNGITTTQKTSEIRIGAFGTTDVANAKATETYSLTATLYTTRASFIPAFDNSGNVTGFTTRSEETYKTSATEATRGVLVATTGTSSYVFTGGSYYSTSCEGVSETVTTQLEWTGLYNKDLPLGFDVVTNGTGGGLARRFYGLRAWNPEVPFGVRVYESFQQKSIYAQIGASGLGFTVPFIAFSWLQQGPVFSPMDTTYTTTDESAGNTRSYTVSVGTSATNDTASFIFVTRATVSTADTSTSASLYNTVELTRRFRTTYPSATQTEGNISVVVGGRQHDTRLEIAAFDEGVIDYTIVDTAAAHAGVLTTIASYTISAASSNLTAFSRLSAWSSGWRGPGYYTTPKWQTVWP